MIRGQIINVPSDGALSFHVLDTDSNTWNEGDGNIGPWRLHKFLYLDGKPLYLIGNECGTCRALFRKLDNAKLPLPPSSLIESFENGLDRISQNTIDGIKIILPKGKYVVGIFDIFPTLVESSRSGSNFYEAEYYWLNIIRRERRELHQEVILPIVLKQKLNKERITHYQNKIHGGIKPTALALSFIDVRMVRGEWHEWTLAHCLLDGHHKLMAASSIGQSISILSFIKTDEVPDFLSDDEWLKQHYHIDESR